MRADNSYICVIKNNICQSLIIDISIIRLGPLQCNNKIIGIKLIHCKTIGECCHESLLGCCPKLRTSLSSVVLSWISK